MEGYSLLGASGIFEGLGFSSHDAFCMALGWCQSVDYYTLDEVY